MDILLWSGFSEFPESIQFLTFGQKIILTIGCSMIATFGHMTLEQQRDTFSQRLRDCLVRAGKSGYRPTDLAREFNRRYAGQPVSMHAARKWLLGEAIPAQDKLLVLARWLGVAPEWLRFGEALASEVKVAEPQPEFDYQLMREIAALPPAQQEFVRVLVRELRRLPG